MTTPSQVPQRSIQSMLRSGVVVEQLTTYINKDEAGRVVASVLGIVNGNAVLQQCSNESILNAVLTGISMGLNVNPSLGQCYIVPYQNKKKITGEDGHTREIKVWEAQFQIGYKGFIQLALRTGLYETMNVTEVREGEFKGEDKLTGEYEFEWEKDDVKREKLPVIGYVGYIKLNSGFRKSRYMTKDKVLAHAKKYSQSFRSGYGLWKTDFDAMAKKTVLKLLISKDGVTTSVLERAMLADQAVVEEDSFAYIDNKKKNEEANKSSNDEMVSKRVIDLEEEDNHDNDPAAK